MKYSATILLAIMTSATAAVSCSSDKKKTATAETPAVAVAKAVTDSVVIYHSYPGSLKADNTVNLVGRVDGILKSQNYEDGQLVEKGQLLFTIEDTQYRDQVQQAESQLATARSNRDYAEAQYTAMKKALESDAVSQMEVNRAKSSLEQAEASIRNAQAQLQTARTNLSYCRVYAPFRGHVSAPTVSVGAYIGGGVSPVTLATIYEDATVYAEFFIADKAMQEILTNNAVASVDLDSIPLRFRQPMPRNYYGRLTYVSPEVDPSTGTLQLRAEVDNSAGDLHDGMYVEIALPAQSDPHAILVKDAAIASDQLGSYLFTLSDSDVVTYTPVHTGDIVRDSMRVITAGIKSGTPYVTKALLKVRDGMTVKPMYEP